MNFIIHDLQQGTPEWFAHRASRNNASDLAVAMGISNHKKRTALLREISTGLSEEVDQFAQRRFDDGHRFEALARPLAEQIIGESLYPITVSAVVEGLRRPLSASLDGSALDCSVNFEHKGLNLDLAAALDQGIIPDEYHPQMEQGMLINGATRCLFMASKWDANDQLIEEKHCWYESNPELRAKIIPIWRQTEEDANNYQHSEAKPEAIAAPIEALPALLVQVEGRVVATNLDVFKAKASAFIASIKTELLNDQDFADAVQMVRFLDNGVAALASAKMQAQAQASDIDAVFKAIDNISEQMRQKRLQLEKLVKTEKDNRKEELVHGAQREFREYIIKLNTRLGGSWMPTLGGQTFPSMMFSDAIKGLKSLDSMRDKVSTVLAHAKIEASEIADRIEANHKSLMIGTENDTSHLFPDFATVCTKSREDFATLHTARIHQEGQRKEAERERIRKEEADRLEREAAEQRERDTPVCEIDGKPAYLGNKFFDRYGKEFTLERNSSGGYRFGNKSTTITMQASGFLAWSQEEGIAKAEAKQPNTPPASEAGTPAGARPEPAAPVSSVAPDGVITEEHKVARPDDAKPKKTIDDFFAEVGTPKAKQANYRAVIMAWEEFNGRATKMEQAA